MVRSDEPYIEGEFKLPLPHQPLVVELYPGFISEIVLTLALRDTVISEEDMATLIKWTDGPNKDSLQDLLTFESALRHMRAERLRQLEVEQGDLICELNDAKAIFEDSLVAVEDSGEITDEHLDAFNVAYDANDRLNAFNVDAKAELARFEDLFEVYFRARNKALGKKSSKEKGKQNKKNGGGKKEKAERLILDPDAEEQQCPVQLRRSARRRLAAAPY